MVISFMKIILTTLFGLESPTKGDLLDRGYDKDRITVNDGVVTLLKSGKVVINMGFRDNKWNVEQRSITLNIPNSGTATDYMLGDINLDGTVNASDATAALSEYARLSTGEKGMFSEKQMLAGDIDRNGQINATDATMILSYYSFLSTGGSGPMEDYINR